MAARQAGCGARIWVHARVVALTVSLILSALLMAVARSYPTHFWLAWVSLAPLFLAIRSLRPTQAAASGAVWGLSLCWFLSSFGESDIAISASSIILIITIPVAYTFLAASARRLPGFGPLALAAGWVAVEFALKMAGLGRGILLQDYGYGSLLQSAVSCLGYAVVAFLILYASALLVTIAGSIRILHGSSGGLTTCTESAGYLALTGAPRLTNFLIPSSQPRAPPLRHLLFT